LNESEQQHAIADVNDFSNISWQVERQTNGDHEDIASSCFIGENFRINCFYFLSHALPSPSISSCALMNSQLHHLHAVAMDKIHVYIYQQSLDIHHHAQAKDQHSVNKSMDIQSK
jgi:hypothetical protein